MSNLEDINVELRLVLQLCTLAALAYLGVWIGNDIVTSVVLAIVLPLAAGLIWARFVALNGAWRLPDPARLAVETVYFAAGIAALLVAGFVIPAVFLLIAEAAHYVVSFRYQLR